MNQQLLLILLLIFGYLAGSIPFGYLISKTKNIDIRKKGSGATGATNVMRAVGFKQGIVVAILDIAKAILPIYIGSLYFEPGWQMALISLAPVFGHIFPVWLNFKGGKGITVIFASMIMILGWKYFLIFLIAWAILLVCIQYMSLTNLIAILAIPFLFWYKTRFYAYCPVYVGLGFIYVIIVWWAHRENIKRLREGTETKIIKF